jgi:hypothetical protein
MERGVGVGHVKKNRLKEVIKIAERAVKQYEEAKVSAIFVFIDVLTMNYQQSNN